MLNQENPFDMNKRIIIPVTVLFLTFFSCENFLEITPEASVTIENFYESESDFVQAVIGTYAPLRDLYEEDWEMTELRSDNTHFIFDIANRGTQPTEDLGLFTVETNNVTVFNKWANNYLIISRANQILGTIDEVDFAQSSKDDLKGQALFLRALAYFDLVRHFGGVPLFLEPPTSYETTFRDRATADEVFDQVVADAQQAAGLLPDKGNQAVGRATSGAANALLGHVYLRLGQWADAETALSNVEDDGYVLLDDYASIFEPANEGNDEIVFEVEYVEGASQNMQSTFPYSFLPELADPAVITGVSPAARNGGGSFNTPTPEMLAAYEDGDFRLATSVGFYTGTSPLVGVTYENTPYIKKYQHPHLIGGQTGQNWIVYRYADVLLMLAEAKNEQGETGEAKGYVDQVRARAGLAATAAGTQSELREAILQERRVELAFENKRWHDLVRAGRAVEVMNEFGSRVNANPQEYYYPDGNGPLPGAFQVDQTRLIYPIPVSEIIINPALNQNPGY